MAKKGKMCADIYMAGNMLKQLSELSLRGKLAAWFETWFIDHEILRKLYRNFHRISADAYRSNHPSARFLKKVQRKYGIKTIVSMRRAKTKGLIFLKRRLAINSG